MCIQRLIGVALLLLAAACQRRPPLVPQVGAPLPVRLDFRPPVGRVLTETATTAREVVRGDARAEDAVELTTETRFTPAGGGWLMTQTVSKARLTRGGEPVATPVVDVLKRFPLQVRLAADGTFVEVVDEEAALKALHEVVPSGWAEELERFFEPEALTRRTRSEWEAKYGGLLGRNLEVGQRTWAVGRLVVGAEEVVYVLERTVTGTEPTLFGDALTLALRCLDKLPEGEEAPSDPYAARGAPAELREVYEAAGSPALTPGVTCTGEQVVARGLFVPVQRGLTVKVKLGEETWTVSTRSQVETLEETQ